MALMSDIAVGQLFILPGVGPVRKVHPCIATQRDGTERVVYPNETVTRMRHGK